METDNSLKQFACVNQKQYRVFYQIHLKSDGNLNSMQHTSELKSGNKNTSLQLAT